MATITAGINTNSTGNTTSYASGSFTPAAGDLLVVFVIASGTTGGTSGGTLSSSAGTTFTQIVNASKGGGADELYLFVANATSSATSQTVTFDCTGDAATGCGIAVMRVAGMSRTGSGAVRQTAVLSDQAGGGNPGGVFSSAVLTGNPHLGFLSNSSSAPVNSAAAGWTEAYDANYNSPTTSVHVLYRNSGWTGTDTAAAYGSTSATAYGCIQVELDSSIPANNGSVTKTLDALTVSSSNGDLAIKGSNANTLGALTVSSSNGDLKIQGSSAPTLGVLTVSGTADLVIKGSVTPGTLGTLTVSSTADLPIKGSTSATLGALTLNGTGDLPINASVTPGTLGVLTLAATGTLPAASRTATLASTLGVLTVTGTGDLPITGSLSATSGVLTAAATGDLVIKANVTPGTLGALGVTTTGALRITANTTGTLGALVTQPATGVLRISGTLAATLGAMTGTASGASYVRGQVTSTLGALTSTSTSTITWRLNRIGPPLRRTPGPRPRYGFSGVGRSGRRPRGH